MLVFLFSGSIEDGQSPSGYAVTKDPVFEKRKYVRDITPTDIVQPPEIETTMVERLPSVEPPPLPPKPPKPIVMSRPTVLAAGIIKVGNKTIHLADINPVPLDKTCKLSGEKPWPCGMLARTEMRMFVRGRPITCNPTDKDEASDITTRCNLSARDMSGWLVQNGWAEPTNNEFQDELKTAQQKGVGIWRKSSR